MKFCGKCGKVETKDWRKHWERNHRDEYDNNDLFELDQDEIPSEPWCTNWKDILEARKSNAEKQDIPLPIDPKCVVGFKQGNKCASSVYKSDRQSMKERSNSAKS